MCPTSPRCFANGRARAADDTLHFPYVADASLSWRLPHRCWMTMKQKPRSASDRGPAGSLPLDGYSRPRTRSMPAITRSSCVAVIRPTRSVRSVRSIATIWETFATESFGSPVADAGSVTFPGAAASRLITGQRHHDRGCDPAGVEAVALDDQDGPAKPGADPSGSSSDAQETSPRPITIRWSEACDARPRQRSRHGPPRVHRQAH